MIQIHHLLTNGKFCYNFLFTPVTDDELRQAFEVYGPLLDSVVMIDKTTNRSRGFGFVTFVDARVAQYVLDSDNIANGKPLPPGGCRSGRFYIKHKWCEVKAAEPKESSTDGTGQSRLPDTHSIVGSPSSFSSSCTKPFIDHEATASCTTSSKIETNPSSPILQSRNLARQKSPANRMIHSPLDYSFVFNSNFPVDSGINNIPYPVMTVGQHLPQTAMHPLVIDPSNCISCHNTYTFPIPPIHYHSAHHHPAMDMMIPSHGNQSYSYFHPDSFYMCPYPAPPSHVEEETIDAPGTC